MSVTTVLYGWTGLSASIILALLVNDLRRFLIERWQERKMEGLIESYNIAPEIPESDLHEWCLTAERAEHEGWIGNADDLAEFVEDGLIAAEVFAAFNQRPDDEIREAA